MKKFGVIGIVCLLFLLFGCEFGVIDYELINNTSYDITLVDDSNINKTEYNVPKNSSIFIKHYNSAHFLLKNNSLPIFLTNTFSFSRVDYLPTYTLQIVNNSGLEFTLKINNDYQESYTIVSSQKSEITVYSKNIEDSGISLYLNNNPYQYFSINDSLLIIY